MYVVYNADSGWSDETMRFASFDEATTWIEQQPADERYEIREEA